MDNDLEGAEGGDGGIPEVTENDEVKVFPGKKAEANAAKDGDAGQDDGRQTNLSVAPKQVWVFEF